MDVNIDLKLTLELHLKWLRGIEGGVRADLTGANLTDANLTRANLTDASYNLRRLLRMALGMEI